MESVDLPVRWEQAPKVVQIMAARVLDAASDQAAFESLLRGLLGEVARLPGRDVVIVETGPSSA